MSGSHIGKSWGKGWNERLGLLFAEVYACSTAAQPLTSLVGARPDRDCPNGNNDKRPASNIPSNWIRSALTTIGVRYIPYRGDFSMVDDAA